MLTPTQELKVINAQLDSATECIAQVNNRLACLRNQRSQHELLFTQLQATLTQLQAKYHELEQQALSFLFPDANH